MRSASHASAAAALGVLCALPAPGRANQIESRGDAQRRAAEGLLPAPLQLPVPEAGAGKNVAVARIRFYADGDYRAGLFRWAERTKAQLTSLNQIVEPAFGVRFEAESFRRWHRESQGIDVEQMLAELEKLDPGSEVDWVVAFVTPLPLVSTSMHEIGAARVLGRHFILRGMASADEARALGQAFDRLEPGEREQIYGRRKWHKECAVFLHEWLHTLGALHSRDPASIMGATYSSKMSSIDPTDAELAALALRARLATRASATGAVDWSALRARLDKASSPDWAPRERDQLLALLRAATAHGAGGPPASPLAPGTPAAAGAEGPPDEFTRAVALMKEGKGDQAWALAKTLAARHPRQADVHRLLCRLSYVPAARAEGKAACARARELAPDRPEPLVDAAQAHIIRKEMPEALAAADAAADLARRLPRGSEEVWVWIAQIYGQVGLLSRADEALERASAGPAVEGARLAVGRDRRSLGLPRPPATGAVPPDRELAYAELHRRATALLDAGKLREAKLAVDSARREFPDAPGVEVLACELDLRQGRPRPAEKACTRALGAMPDLPRAHYLLGHLRLQTNARQAAIEELRRCIELDPRESAAWQTLAEVYRVSGKRQELASLRVEFQKVFARPLR